MKTFILNPTKGNWYSEQLLGMLCFGFILWWLLPHWLGGFTEMAFADPGIWHLIVLSFLLWLASQLINVFAFGKLLQVLGLPSFRLLLLEFNGLSAWQKYVLYFGLFALWWLSMVFCLMAVL